MVNLSYILRISMLAGALGVLPSCGSGSNPQPNAPSLPETGNLKSSAPADTLFAQAAAFEKQGEPNKAFSLYKKIAVNHKYSTQAPNALYRMAQHYEAEQKPQKAFDTYQKLISDYVHTSLYKPSLQRQINIAHATVEGEHQNQFLFFNTKIPSSIIDTMLTQVLSNAPYDSTAAKSSYLRGILQEQGKSNTKAIQLYRQVTRTYPDSVYSGEALYRIGNILHQQSLQGNTNLDNSRKAIETFDELITLYPSHPRSKDAKKLKATFAGYDTKRSLEIAEFYEKKQHYTSAIFYYKEVLKSSAKASDYHKIASAKIAALTSEPVL